MEQETRKGRLRTSFPPFWLLSTPRRSSRRGNRRARRQGESLVEAGLSTSTQTGRRGTTGPAERVRAARSAEAVKTETSGFKQIPEDSGEREIGSSFFLPHPPNQRCLQDRRFYPHLRTDSLAQPSGLHPILGSCGARLAGRHAQLIPLEGRTSTYDISIQKFHTASWGHA